VEPTPLSPRPDCSAARAEPGNGVETASGGDIVARRGPCASEGEKE